MLPVESSLPIARRATWRDTECLELVCGIANAGGGRLILDADVDSRGAVKRRTSRLMKTIPGLIAQSLNTHLRGGIGARQRSFLFGSGYSAGQ